VRFELVLGAEQRPAGARMPTDLVVVLDRSGSMQGTKMSHARAAIRALVEQLAPEDRFALVTYAQGVEHTIALEAPSPASRARWLAAVNAIPARGGTHLSGGLDAGLQVVESSRAAGRAPRVILISDGLANQGDTSRAGLRARAVRAASGEYALSTVGVGVDFDGELMALLADAGTGNFHFLENAVDLAEVFAAEFETARETVASGLAVAMSPADGVEVVEAAGYPLERGDEGEIVFRPGTLFAGQERRVWVTLRVANRAAGLRELGGFGLSFRADGERRQLALAGMPRVATVANEESYYAGFDKKAWERSAVVDRLNSVRRRAANAVAAGRPEEALAEIRSYKAEIAPQAARLPSTQVDAALEDADALASEVEQHAEGKKRMAPASLQQLRALGYVEGRAGSRK
jgi:Ca-activated chloride channel family protein